MRAAGVSWRDDRRPARGATVSYFEAGKLRAPVIDCYVSFLYDDNFPSIEVDGLGGVAEHSSVSTRYQNFVFDSKRGVLVVTGTSHSGAPYKVELCVGS